MLPRGRPISAPCPAWSVLPRRMRSRSPPATTATSSTRRKTSSERRSAPAKPNSSSARSRRPRLLWSQVASSWRSMASDSAAAWRAGRPWLRSSPCSGPWMSRWPGFHGRSLKRCILPNRRQPPADGAGGVAFGQAGEIGADGGRRGGHRDKTVRRAPGGKMRPVGFVGAQRGRRGGAASEGLRRGQRRLRRPASAPGRCRRSHRGAGFRPIRRASDSAVGRSCRPASPAAGRNTSRIIGLGAISDYRA